jgi:uncharacterized membrane protein
MNVFGNLYELTLGNPATPLTLGIGALVLLLMTVFTYQAYRAKGPRFWLVPAGARFFAVAFLAICVSQPALKSTRTVVTRGRIAVLLDVSKSMSLGDMPDGRSRCDAAKSLLFGPDETLVGDLADTFDVELFEFANEAVRVPSSRYRSLSPPEGTATRMAESLRTASGQRTGAPLAGVVLVSDGQDNGAEDVVEAARAVGVPVHTVGVGAYKPESVKDLALADLRVEKKVLAGSTVVVDVSVLSRGISATAPVALSCGGKQIANALVGLTPGEKETVTLQFVPKDVGHFVYSVSTPARPEELTAENNRCSFSLEVVDRTLNILLIEGMMRWEYKFLRRVLAQDKDVNLDSYLRVGQDRFYYQPSRTQRSDKEQPSASGHQGGLPLTLAALEGFDVVIFGDIAAKHFSAQQLQAVADFVSETAGAFLMLGGKSTFASGGYAGTPIEKILPVAVKPEGDPQEEGKFRPVLTPDGENHPVLKLDPNPDANKVLWAGLPLLDGSNRTGPPKPGATVLLTRRSARRIRAADTILAVQRYGKGKTGALTVDTTWHWDLQSLGLGRDSRAYQQFWAQLVRWLMPDPDSDTRNQRAVRVATDKTEYRQAENVNIEVRVLDSGGKPLDDAKVDGTLRSPDGGSSPLSLAKSANAGIYAAVYVPRSAGPYEVSARASEGGETLGTDSAAFLVGEAIQELLNTDLNVDLLHALAEATGGKYHPPEKCREIVSSIPVVKKETIKTERVRLWNSPLLLIAFITLATVEWLIRRYAVGP